ncbi:MAG: WD40 domain-containing protein, partial [Candidatus Kariarchaeaceae archaeon]
MTTKKFICVFRRIFLIFLCSNGFIHIFNAYDILDIPVGRIETIRQKTSEDSAILKAQNERIINPQFGERIFANPLIGHEGIVTSVKFSPNETILASSGSDQTIRLWNVRTGVELTTPHTRHNDSEGRIAFSPDGNKIAFASNDGRIKYWDVKKGEVSRNLTLGDGEITFSPNRDILALSGSPHGNYLKLVNETNGQLLGFLEDRGPKSAYSVAFSPNGSLLASGIGHSIFLWNVSSKRIWQKLSGHQSLVSSVHFSPDGKMIVSGSIDNTIRIWNITKNEVILWKSLQEADEVRSVMFSPCNSQIIASGNKDTKVRLWNITSGKEIKVMEGHADAVFSICFSPDGTLLASCSEDTTIQLWNVVRGVESRELLGLEDVKSLVFTQEILASGSNGLVRLWNTSSGGELLPPFTEHDGDVLSIDFSPDGSLVASGGIDSLVHVWNRTNRNIVYTLKGHIGEIRTIAFSGDGTYLASGSSAPDNVIKIWDMTDGQLLRNLTGHTDNINSISFSPSNQIVASGARDSNIILWNITSGENISVLTEHISWVNTLAFSPVDENILISAGRSESRIILWNLSSLSEIRSLTRHGSEITSVDFSPDGQTILSGSFDKTINLWSTASGDLLYSFPEESDPILSITYSPEGKLIAFTTGSTSKMMSWVGNLFPLDLDSDGLPDEWEDTSFCDRTDFWDKFNDPDDDGLINSLEWFYDTNANNNDSDTDTMFDGWEWFMGLDPLRNDSLEDTDNDGIPNLYEFQHDLHPRTNDAWEDGDADGMPNIWEFRYKLNASNPNDALVDSDGDWVRNIDEFLGGSDPLNFFSVPRISMSIFHIGGAGLLLFFVFMTFIVISLKQRRELVTSLAAPDYTIAKKIQEASLPNYSAFKQAELEAQTILQNGDSLFNQGLHSEAVQQYKLALTKFEWLQNNQLIAESVFKISRIQVEMEELSSESKFLQQFPKRQKDEVMEGLFLMLQALLAEAEKEWKRAGIAWQHAFDFQTLEPQYQILCQSKVIENKVKSWLNNPTGSIDNNLLQSMEKWQQECQTKQYPEGLCSLLFLRARIELASFQLDE